jgi:hypothetical protein
LVVAAIAVFIVTVSLPAAAAWQLNTRRVRQTQELLTAVAASIRMEIDALSAGPQANEIIRSSGRLPFPSDGAAGEWARRAVRSPESFGNREGPDAWGRCLFLDLESLQPGKHVWVLSAGPNMVVETPPGSDVLRGDDIGLLIK